MWPRRIATLAELKHLPNVDSLTMSLYMEIEGYHAECIKWVAHLRLNPHDDSPTERWKWWLTQRLRLPAYFMVA